MEAPSPIRTRFEVAEIATAGAIYGVLAWRIIFNIAEQRWETLLLLAVTLVIYFIAFWLLARLIRWYAYFLHRRWPQRARDPQRLLNPLGQLSGRWQWIFLTIIALLGAVRDISETGGDLNAFLTVLDFTMAGLVTWSLLGARGRPGRLTLTGALAGAVGSGVIAFAYLAATGGDIGDIVPPVAWRWTIYGLGMGVGLGFLRGRPAVRMGLGLASAIVAAGLLTQRSEVAFVWPYQVFLAAGWTLMLALNRSALAAMQVSHPA